MCHRFFGGSVSRNVSACIDRSHSTNLLEDAVLELESLAHIFQPHVETPPSLEYLQTATVYVKQKQKMVGQGDPRGVSRGEGGEGVLVITRAIVEPQLTSHPDPDIAGTERYAGLSPARLRFLPAGLYQLLQIS